MDAPASSAGEGVAAFHGDRRGQILPLVFILGIAFFTSTVLVLNTGRTTVRRIQAQNAVDASVVSGTTSIARGMNYVSSNNTSISKALALVVIMRAFPNAFEAAELTLELWNIAAQAMHGAANTPWTAWLHVAATAIEIKVEIEQGIIDIVKPIIEELADALGVDDEEGGAIWMLIQGLDYLGEVIVYATPVLAQWAAIAVFERNIAPETGQAWLLPIYPAMPACEGTFGDFYDWTRHWAEAMADPIYIAGWIALTLSLFPLWYQASLEVELHTLFTGEEGSFDTTDETLDQLNEMQGKIDEIAAKMRGIRDARSNLLRELLQLGKDVGLDVSSEEQRLGEIDAEMADNNQILESNPENPTQADKAAKEDAMKAVEDLSGERDTIYGSLVSRVNGAIPHIQNEDAAANAQERLHSTLTDPKGIDPRWQDRLKQLEDLSKQMEDLNAEDMVNDRLEGGEPPDDFDGSLGDKPENTQDRDWPHPWLLDASKYPDSFSYVGIAWRDLREPIVDAYFKRKMSVGFTYAAARVYNATQADLFTADWRARLVRVEASMLENPLGSLPSECGDEGGGSGESEMQQSGIDLPDGESLAGTLDQILKVMSKH